MELKRACLAIADISGYTRFLMLHSTSLLHAEVIITELLEAVIGKAQHPLTIAKLEGDAVFLYAVTEDASPAARDVLKQAAGFFETFREKERELIACNTCRCPACQSIEKLQLKVLLHYGEIAVKQVQQFTELAGENVILIHRLLKNTVSAKEYILMTDTFHTLSGGIEGAETEFRTEHAEGIGEVAVRVWYPPVHTHFPERPAPLLPKPGTKSAALYERFNEYARRRLSGAESRRSFSSLAELKINAFSRLGYQMGIWLAKIGSGINSLFISGK